MEDEGLGLRYGTQTSPTESVIVFFGFLWMHSQSSSPKCQSPKRLSPIGSGLLGFRTQGVQTLSRIRVEWISDSGLGSIAGLGWLACLSCSRCSLSISRSLASVVISR